MFLVCNDSLPYLSPHSWRWMMRYILASSSKRRQQIMSMLGFRFEVVNPNIKEELVGCHPVINARRLALKKAHKVWRENKDAIVIASDTIVFFDDKIFGKPKDKEEAVRMLKDLSGRWHNVVTAIAVIGKFRRRVGHDVTRVKFRKLSDEEIVRYVESWLPLDKAGAYGIQDYGASFIERIEGDFYTVMGMSPRLLLTLLELQ